MQNTLLFDPHCSRCPRLDVFLKDSADKYPDYHCAPVPAFGADNPGLLIVGLAPGLHGANASGRPFTGDHAGILLYQTLFDTGFSNKPVSEHRNDDLSLNNCRITNAVKCVPPQNKPTTAEVNECNNFLRAELAGLQPGSVILALGGIAHRAVLKAFDLKLSASPFGHANQHKLANDLILLDSYHCSRYNTQTKRLTTEMFRGVFDTARELISSNKA